MVASNNFLNSDIDSRENTGDSVFSDDLLYQVPHVYRELSAGATVYEPLGLALSLARLETGSFLLLEKGPGCNGQRYFCLERQKSYGDKVHGLKEKWNERAGWGPENMQEKLLHTAGLLNRIERYLTAPGLPGLSSAVDEMDKLLLSTVEPGCFDFEPMLVLHASFLMLITGAEGAFAFGYEPPLRTLTAWFGEPCEILQPLSEDWVELGRKGDPLKDFSGQVQPGLRQGLRMAFRRGNSASICLGLLAKGGLYPQEALHLLADRAAAARGLASPLETTRCSWQNVFDSIEQGIIVTDSQGKVLLRNRAAEDLIAERGKDPLGGRQVKNYGLGTEIEEAIYSAARSGCSYKQRRSSLGEGDEALHLRWDVVPLLHQDGHSDGAILVFSNITAPIQVHQQIQEWERLATAGEVAASLGHEIRNPLATAKAAVQLIRMDGAPQKQEELLSKLDRELDRMNDILTKFINIARPQQEDQLEPVDLRQVLQELLFLLNSEAVLREIELATVFPDERDWVVLGSPSSIKQVCLNVARNAFEAMEKGGRLTVSLSSKNSRAHVLFEDTGPGIPAENIAALTRPFFTTKREGTGLGLAISQSILKSMGGSLKIKSCPGEGTTVELLLPLHVA